MQFALIAEFYFINGSTDKTIHHERLTEEVIYGRDEQISSLACYLELMDRLLPNFLSVLTNQTLRHSRFLLT